MKPGGFLLFVADSSGIFCLLNNGEAMRPLTKGGEKRKDGEEIAQVMRGEGVHSD